MSVDSIQEARQQRHSVWRVATRISEISELTGQSPEYVSPEILLNLPKWCMQDLEEIRALQRTCGALYFAPLIATSIDGNLLRGFRDFAGTTCFNHIRQTMKSHEVKSKFTTRDLPVNVMAAGSSVLISTVNNEEYKGLYQKLIGPISLKLDEKLGLSLLEEANEIIANTAKIDTRTQ